MKHEHYVKISDFFRKYDWGERFIIEINRWSTYFVYVAFIGLLISLAINKDERIIRVILTCGISFILVTIFRMICNSERPYTKYKFTPLISKDKVGQSMPSRHVFSTFVITMAFAYTYSWAFIPLLVVSMIIAVGRVLGGVHFPKDVIVGAIIGVISGILGFYVI